MQIKSVVNNDEYYSPKNVVNIILPYIQKSGYKNIWCPFDKKESNFVKIFKENGFIKYDDRVDRITELLMILKVKSLRCHERQRRLF